MNNGVKIIAERGSSYAKNDPSERVFNLYTEGFRRDKDAPKINPMELWDVHFIRTLDDAGFVDQLYSRSAR